MSQGQGGGRPQIQPPGKIEKIDYIQAVEEAGLTGQSGKKVQEAMKFALAEVSAAFGRRCKFINKPGAFLERSDGTYQVQKNGTLLKISVME